MIQNGLAKLLFIIGSPVPMIILKTTFLVALGLVLVWLTRSARASVRHLLLACTFAALLVVPLAGLLVPAFRLEMESVYQIEPATIEARPTQNLEVLRSQPITGTSAITNSDSRLPSWQTVAWLVWGLGAALLLLRLAVSMFRLRRIRQTAIPCLDITNTLQALIKVGGIKRKVEVLLHNKVEVPFTYGHFRPAILLPNDAATWNEADLERVMVHELEHIKRADWTIQVMARVVCAFYWFQPLVWMAWRKICLEAERACDDAVVIQTERTDYAEQLVNLAKRLSSSLAPPVLSMANRSDLSHRVSAILNNNQARGRAGLRWTAMSIACSAVVILGVSPELAVSQTPKPRTVTLINKTGGRSPVTTNEIVVFKVPETKTRALNEALIKASEAGELNDIEQLLSAGAEINGLVEGDGTPLIVAAREGHLEAVSLLLNHGADVNLASPGDGNPLIMAAREGQEEVVKLLLNQGAQVNQIVEGDENALIQASGSGRLGIVKLLVERGADVNARVWSGSRDGEWRTALLMARKEGHKDVVEFLVGLGAKE